MSDVYTHIYTHVKSVSLEFLGQCRDRVKALWWWPLIDTLSRMLALSTWMAEVGRLGVINPYSGRETKAERGRCLPSVLCIVRVGWGWSLGPRGPFPSPRDGPSVQVTVR